MHEPLLAKAALPAPDVVLGMLLRPYSLGHELFLVREQNPLVSDPAKAALSDLLAAVLICCQTWGECQRVPFDRLMKLKLWLWKRRLGRIDFDAQLSAFLEYRHFGSLEFPLSDIVRPGRSSTPRMPGAPFILRLQQWLMTHFHLSESAAWDYPVGLAKMRWETHWEGEEGLDIYNAHDAEFDAFVQEQEAGAALCPAS